ncbi:hypothetical protein TrVE_jg7741 [Triparma verrucosa]|uniref:DUF819-domain-containing protein n=1 Tax=Triparma verrucosa TaxID=1606542 RepID=A0A9W7B162_9STRA|nr:hypothetical protein TrVE_jg7741 [Triparma verrucosa]
MFVSILLSNLNVIPFVSPTYKFINSLFVPLSIPCLLYSSDLRRILKSTQQLLPAFVLGTISTVLSTIVTFKICALKSLGGDGWKIASALAARHIGGAINFISVSETLNIQGSSISSSIAADNIVVALYFSFLFLSSNKFKKPQEVTVGADNNPKDIKDDGEGSSNLETIALALFTSSSLCFAGSYLTQMFIPSASSLPIISLLTVAASTGFPKFFSNLSEAGGIIGVIFIQLFFAASGAAGSIADVLKNAPVLFLFSGTQILLHYVSLMALGRIFKIGGRELYVASNANVGGPTTAAAMAKGKNWPDLILPGLLVGILGYATGTIIGLSLGFGVLQKLI